MTPLTVANRIFIGLGSNLGDCRANLAQAVTLIEDTLKVKAEGSSVYHSEPVEVTDQPWFFNQVLCLDGSEIDRPTLMLEILKGIETRMGRQPTFRFGPRLIDLDLLLFKDWVFEGANLVVPHPKISERSFVLIPSLEIDPHLVHPRLGSFSRLLAAGKDTLTPCHKI